MDKISHYRNLIKQYLKQYAELMDSQPVAGLETVLSFDDEHNQYMLLKMGWPQGRRIRHTLLHVSIQHGKISIEEDMTEEGVANFLASQGVPDEDVVLGFQPPSMRVLAEHIRA